MIDASLDRSGAENAFSSEHPSDCPLWDLCGSVADQFVRGCLNADNPFVVRRRLERQISANLGYDETRAEALFELSLEALHLRCEGRYQKEVTEVARLMAVVTGGDETFCQN